MLRASVAAALAFTSLVAARASAQDPCPDPDVAQLAPDQALCWFLEHEAAGAQCARDALGSSACAVQASAWCDSAALDDASVASACLLAHVVTRRLDAAYALLRGLPSDLTPDAARCRDALLAPIPARIASNPEGAELTLDGRRLGPAPVDLALLHPFADHEIVARWGEETVVLSRDEVLAAFDPTSCSLSPLLLIDPTPPEPPPAAASGGTTVVVREASGRDEVLTVAGILLTSAGLLVGGAGVGFVVHAESLAVDLAQTRDIDWSPRFADQLATIETLRPAGWAMLAGGLLVTGTGLVMVIVDRVTAGSPTDTDEEDAARVAVVPGIGGLLVRGSF